MAHAGSPDTLEKHQHEVCNAFARAAAAMRDAAHTAESFSNWFSRVNNIQNVPVPPMFNNGPYNFMPNFGGAQQYPVPEPEQTGNKRKASGDPETKKKRQTRERKVKDANAPKRPPSAYLLFQNEVRMDVKSEHPEMTYNQVLAEISKIWHAMTAEEKLPYMQVTADSKVLYEKAKADYEAHTPTDTTTKPVAVKPATVNSKTPASAATGVTKSAAQPASTSGDEESSESSSDTGENKTSDDEGEEEEEEPVSAPEPPRKKAKKDAVKAPTPPPVKAEKKKNGEGKKKKKVDT